jgi:hypothetical protein
MINDKRVKIAAKQFTLIYRKKGVRIDYLLDEKLNKIKTDNPTYKFSKAYGTKCKAFSIFLGFILDEDAKYKKIVNFFSRNTTVFAEMEVIALKYIPICIIIRELDTLIAPIRYITYISKLLSFCNSFGIQLIITASSDKFKNVFEEIVTINESLTEKTTIE